MGWLSTWFLMCVCVLRERRRTVPLTIAGCSQTYTHTHLTRNPLKHVARACVYIVVSGCGGAPRAYTKGKTVMQTHISYTPMHATTIQWNPLSASLRSHAPTTRSHTHEHDDNIYLRAVAAAAAVVVGRPWRPQRQRQREGQNLCCHMMVRRGFGLRYACTADERAAYKYQIQCWYKCICPCVCVCVFEWRR